MTSGPGRGRTRDDTESRKVMRKVILNEFLSLDGVAQAPGGADEDPSDGFAHGGWHMPAWRTTPPGRG